MFQYVSFFVSIFNIVFPSEKVGFPFFDFGGALGPVLSLPEPNCEGVDQSVGRDGRSISLSLLVRCVLGGEPQVHKIVFYRWLYIVINCHKLVTPRELKIPSGKLT